MRQKKAEATIAAASEGSGSVEQYLLYKAEALPSLHRARS